jgi:hypothetical protein
MLKTTDDWIQLAQLIWDICAPTRAQSTGPLTDVDVLGAIHTAAKNAFDNKHADTQMVFMLGALIVPIDGQITSICLYRWAEGGFPTIEIGEKFAASMLVSSISDEVLAQVNIPWPGISIIVPGDLLLTYDPTKKEHIPIRRIFATKAVGKRPGSDTPISVSFGGDWQFIGMATEILALWRFGVTPQGMMVDSNHILSTATEDEKKSGALVFNMEHTDVDARTAGLIGRLIVSACVALTMKELVTERQARPQSKKKKKRDQKEGPSARFYTIGKPIQLDFRPRVRQFMMGEKTSKELSVQHMVAGHFKQQPFGKGREQRKTIWVEPYWKGNEDAAIPIRSHVIKE